MSRHRIRLSVVIMAYNEEASIEKQARATARFLKSAVEEGQVVIVNDGSSDRTASIADALAQESPVFKVVHHHVNLGMGRAIVSGYANADMDWVTQLPGDGQVVPSTLERFLPHTATNDLVLSTYTRRDDGLVRAIVTAGYQNVAKVLLGDSCAFTGTMMFRRKLLENVDLVSESFMVNVELPLKLMRAGTVPAWVTIEALAREHGRSKVLSARRIALVVREMVALRRELVVPYEG